MGISAAELIGICVPSAVFFRNNVEKVKNGEKARGPVAFAQGAKIVEAVAKYHDNTAKTASEAYNIFGKYAQKYKPLDVAGKGVNWATKNVNPLIYASGVYKTLTSDEKLKTGIIQLGAISTMRLGERFMSANMEKVINEKNITDFAKKHKNVTGLKSICDSILKSGNANKFAAALKGIAFVCTSMASYAVGEKLAVGAAKRICTDSGIDDNSCKKINHMA